MIIALGHKKHTGKDSTANCILEHFPEYKPKKLSFALPLKQTCYNLLGWTGLRSPEYYETLPHEKATIIPVLGKSARDIWIEVGIFFRGIHPDIWVHPAIQAAKRERIAIITDLRFPNEARLLKEAGAILIKVVRPQVKPSDDAADIALDGFDGWDYTFTNKSLTLLGLKRQVKKELIPQIIKRVK